MTNTWMVRAGRGGYVIEDFEKQGCVAVALLTEHYENLDAEARSLVPLKQIYWPV